VNGLFIALEGPDGSGKSTIAKLLGAYLKKKDIPHIITREPGGTKIGEKIRDLILDKENTHMSDETEALLYAASRGQHVDEKIVPALKEGKVVLCDRFVLSSLAYQGRGRGIGIEKVKMINDFAIKDLYPDLILFFYIDPSITLKRKIEDRQVDRLELEGDLFHQNVYKGYMEVLDMYPKNIKKIDATGSIEEVLSQSINEIESLLKSRGVIL
jgi:dTMP kinase